MSDRTVCAFFQPIVRLDDSQTVGYEALGRSSLLGLETPESMFQMAAVLKVEAELSRILRFEAIQTAGRLPGAPNLFFNTHPVEFAQPGIDAEVVSVLMIAGTLLWPIWARVHTCTARQRQRMAKRISREMLRLSLHGNLHPEKYPDLDARNRQPVLCLAVERTSQEGAVLVPGKLNVELP